MLDLSQLAQAVRSENGVSRRLFLSYGAALAALPNLATQSRAADRKIRFTDNPFALGVASGDPDATSVVLWTRLAPKPMQPDYGMTPETVAVTWELADDEQFKKVVQSGTANATPELGHSVHVEVSRLAPNRWYFYRFRAGDVTSPIGRTRTLPAADSMPESLRFAFASCQHYETGLYTAYEQMAQDNLDLVFHLGDYIYEYAGADKRVRKHTGPAKTKILSLEDYRGRHAQYRSDPLLHGMHAQCPWFVTWDDHEFDNNYANDISEKKGVDPVAFLKQRAFAYQAYYEAMPLRARSLPKGPDMQLYRKASFGRLAELLVLDTRQYRTDQPNGDGAKPLNEAALNPKNSLLGMKQRGWLQDSLLASKGTWNVLAQQVMMGMVALRPAEGDALYSMDQWPGAAHERMALVQFMADRKIANPVVLTGDIHSNWVNDLHVDDRKPETPVVATEFVGTSISSGGNGPKVPKLLDVLMSRNPTVKFHDQQRGYVRCIVTPKNWQSDYVIVEDVTKPGGKVVTAKSFVVEAGQAGAKSA
ncbi:alkaline phosphatase D family protein [Tuwongella immobilis]|uniref:PhoD-like phosphatase metallophosphatase domain-containing protein n=1 Tax=Tuwongella immobilis TaxID=692036 RepID=A0A6C2YHD5_9BACT|nr:alkaline phosphatase D family protein [Tuwongella immobilis]VIP00938.1 alkaline phosphatase : Alkaline phosphatase D (Precursor) OS=Planctomyces maris DSM 8797 GN=PM8797T_14564 PE=4 SV=1: PhoD [Tuwongella immobilis]VTR97294.1 alkaline phosphatase : Alkaline phosphatase D (Precursor) OS=Planctomyces maris DSM 8797 GN=PM8797T_14564 PE=4 SV=1: PhoD [Tuwongella immobilis]